MVFCILSSNIQVTLHSSLRLNATPGQRVSMCPGVVGSVVSLILMASPDNDDPAQSPPLSRPNALPVSRGCLF